MHTWKISAIIQLYVPTLITKRELGFVKGKEKPLKVPSERPVTIIHITRRLVKA